MKFKALVVRETSDYQFLREIEERDIDDLPPGEVLIHVKYSSLNYKDALSAIGNKGVTRKYPHTPGIDAAGIVAEGDGQKFRSGDEVLVTGYELGSNTDGGFGEFIRVPVNWVVKKPSQLSLKECMSYGTAGFTAGQCLLNFEKVDILPENGEVLVTGATGGVGCLAAAILAKVGYEVVAATGKLDQTEFLRKLGVIEVIHRDEVLDESNSPMLKSRWAGVVDTVGGNFLASALKTTQHRGAIAVCGLVASHKLNTTVFPFILRGVKLLGIDSAWCPMESRLKIWDRLANEWKIDTFDEIVREIPLEQLNDNINMILKGKVHGRIVVKHTN